MDLAGRTHTIELPLGPSRTVNVTLVEGDELTLIDTGVLDPRSLIRLDECFADRGLRLGDLDQIVITHPHHDHFGAAAELMRRTGARLIGDGIGVMAAFPQSFEPNGRFRRMLYAESGAPVELLERWRDRSASLVNDCEPVIADRSVVDGDLVSIGGSDWLAISTPGHAVSSICLFEPESGLLASGDILLGNGASNVTCYETARPGRWLLDIIESLAHLATFPVVRAHTGHGTVIEDAHRVIVQRRERCFQRLDEVGALIAEKPHTSFEIAQSIYPKAIASSSMGLSQSIGYLEALEASGRAQSALTGNTRQYWT